MPTAEPSLDRNALRELLRANLHADVPLDDVGLELEWLVRDPTQPALRPDLAQVQAAVAAAGHLPGGGALTIEPGGQIELVTPPHPNLEVLCARAADDLLQADRSFVASGLELVALGCDPQRTPARVLQTPRYRAMQDHLDVLGTDGARMMCNTASIQINTGRGVTSAEVQRRWHIANAIGPVLVASFANSPFDERGPSGWMSTRLRAWWNMDGSRTAPVSLDQPMDQAWERYVLDASVMLIRCSEEEFVGLEPGFSFEQWLLEGHELGYPSAEDFAYHLTTVFPPVRPRGWLELRMLDSLPTPLWEIATAVVLTLLHPAVHAEATGAVAGTEALWTEASRDGLAHPALAAAAETCFAVVSDHLAETRVDEGLRSVVATYNERWIQRGRCPANDVLDQFHVTGDRWPAPVAPVPFTALEASLT